MAKPKKLVSISRLRAWLSEARLVVKEADQVVSAVAVLLGKVILVILAIPTVWQVILLVYDQIFKTHCH